ncbi:hypothetical protein J2795_002920 [Chryseobacterium bernardetii]|jgi:hypothetical protein|uniref:Uncharacterized protein n=1 Tax=Chryseobacterium bernardetii TaxID=1241978 RepID=A0ACC6IX57_9FLAO|nr:MULTISPECIES: hypothetical protein [Chryseobacterium]MDR6371293.1 hypothetical protein [Chryseobacterium vietnamense]MDR6442202.1 hypothetical protein [Chryseobacterium bernardetii]
MQNKAVCKLHDSSGSYKQQYFSLPEVSGDLKLAAGDLSRYPKDSCKLSETT